MPTVSLNALNVKTLPPLKGRRTNYRDLELRGFMLRVTASGARSYAITYSRRHRNYTYTLGPIDRLALGGKDGAREEARRLLAKITLGAHPAEVRAKERRDQLTVGLLCDEAMAAKTTLVLLPSTRRQWSWIVKKLIKPELEHEPAATLRRERIRAWGEKLEQGSAANASAAFTVLRRVYSWAVERDKLEASPFVNLPPAGEKGKASDRVLSADELRALLRALDALPGAYSDATRLLLLTAVRLEAVRGARYSELEDLDGKEPRWVVPPERNKGGQRQHLVPLSPPAAAIFARRKRKAGGDVVFPTEAARGGPMPWSSRYVERLRAKMGKAIPRWRVHDLRHTVATHLTEDLGVDERVVSLLLGHTLPGVPGISKIYNRAERLADRRSALQAWAEWLEGLRDARGTRRAG